MRASVLIAFRWRRLHRRRPDACRRHWFQKKAGLALGILTSGFGASGFLIPVIVWLIDDFGCGRRDHPRRGDMVHRIPRLGHPQYPEECGLCQTASRSIRVRFRRRDRKRVTASGEGRSMQALEASGRLSSSPSVRRSG